MLKIRNLTKVYGKSTVKALDDVSLELKKGEIFGFLGPNGAGKTTMIKVLTGILPYGEGSIEICGEDLHKNPRAAKLNVGYVPDSHIVFDKLTGREYVDFMADIYGVSMAQRKERAENLKSQSTPAAPKRTTKKRRKLSNRKKQSIPLALFAKKTKALLTVRKFAQRLEPFP